MGISKAFGRLAAGFLTLVLAVGIGYGVYQVYIQTRQAPTTMRAVSSAVDEGIDITGWIIRDETVIFKEAGRAYVTLAASGERVSAGEVIGISFAAEADGAAYRQILALDAQINALTGLAGQGSALDIVTYNRYIQNQLESLASQTQLGEYTAPLAETKAALAKNLSLRATALSGEEDSGQALLAFLATEKNDLTASMGEPVRKLQTEHAGYFCRYVDGREHLLSPAQVLTMTPEEFRKAREFPAATIREDEVLGKLIGGHGWYFAAELSEKAQQVLEVGKEYTLSLANNRLQASLLQISAEEENMTLAIFYSRIPLADVTLYREQTCRVVLNTYEGVKVPAEALRVLNGEPGVFVLEGAKAVFKPAEILYTGDNYYMLAISSENRRLLFMNDRILVGGKDLYDGKVIS